jgi:hypothetical protein
VQPSSALVLSRWSLSSTCCSEGSSFNGTWLAPDRVSPDKDSQVKAVKRDQQDLGRRLLQQ